MYMLNASIVLFYFLTSFGCTKKTENIDDHPNWNLLPVKECGITRYDNVVQRIVKGEEAPIGKFPWIAKLGKAFKRTPEKPFFNCAGTLLNKQTVVSAAHCGKTNDIARLGENYAGTDIDCDGPICAPKHQDIGIAEYIFNGYVKKTHLQDICLIRLAEPVKFNEFVKPACLPSSALLGKDMTGMQTQIAGWGYVDSKTHVIPKKLMYITAPIIKKENCDKLYAHKLQDSQFCVGYAKGKDSCSGDSGGPLTKSMKVDGRRQHYILAIVSFGLQKCGAGPAVYTSVPYYAKWILDNIKE